MREANADRRDLARVRAVGVDPDAGVLGETTGTRETELRQRVDEQLLDAVHVIGRAERVVDRQDRVPDELARTVVGDVAAALHGDEIGTDRGRITPQVGGEVGARDRT